MDGVADRFLQLVHDLEEVRDSITAQAAHAQFDELTLQVFWLKWPGLAQWAGSLWKMLSDDLAGPASPHHDPELDEVGGSG